MVAWGDAGSKSLLRCASFACVTRGSCPNIVRGLGSTRVRGDIAHAKNRGSSEDPTEDRLDMFGVIAQIEQRLDRLGPKGVHHVRIGQKFSFEIRVDEQLNPEQVLLPPMLVQPFVENAIQYGLRHKTSPGHLRIEFRREQDELWCEVHDDGIGRVAAGRLHQNRPPRNSQSTRITEERLQSLHKLIQTRAGIDILALYDPEGQPAGTKVLIRFPYLTISEQYAPEIHHH